MYHRICRIGPLLAVFLVTATTDDHSGPCRPYSCEFGECISEGPLFSCKCQPGFVGPTCNIGRSNLINCDIDGPFVCFNEGVCNTTANSYTCACPPNFTGYFCEEDVDECARLPCQNGAKCVNRIGSYHCICRHGFKGTNCEERFEVCTAETCLNGGLCIDGTDGYVCECPWGYSGPRCQDAELSTSGKTEKTEITKSDCGDDGDGCLITTSGPFASCSLSSYCSRVFRNDICDEVCDTEPCMFDGFDCISKESKCPDSISAYCKERKGNGVCDEPCNQDACDFDGGDCREAFPELLPGEVLIVVQAKPSHFIANIASFLNSLSRLLRTDVRIKRDDRGPMIFLWKDGKAGERIIVGKQEHLHSMDNQGILAWIEIDVSSCINECFSDIEAVASFIEASRQDFDAMNMTIHSAVARKPKDRESRKVSLVLMMTLITIMIVFAVIFTVLDRSSRKRKVIEGAPVWIPPKEFEIEKQGEINGEKPGLFPKFALKSSKRQRMDSAEINLLEKSLASKLPRLPTLPRRKKLQPLPSQLHIESASEHPVSFPLTAEEANRRGPYGRTALMLLAKNTLRSEEQVVDDVTKLHAAGADVNLCDDYDDTALHMAVSAGRVALVRKLLHLGASPVIRDRTNSTCLHLAARACKCDIMAALLENEEMRKEVDAVDDSNRTALMLVAMHDRVDAEAAQMLLDAGADVNYAGDNTLNSWNGRTALHFAAKYDNSQMVAFLVRKLALINSKDYENCTPLHLAAAEGHVGPVMELIRAGASVLMRNDKFQTPYDVAFLNSCHGVARLLGSGDNNRVQLYSNNGEIIACSSSPKRKNTKVLTKKSTEEIQGCISCEPAGLTFSTYNHLTEASSMSICGATFSSPQSSNTLAGRMASSNSAPQCGPPAQHSTPYVQLLENGGAPVNGEISSPHCEGLKRRFALSEGSMEESSECIDSGFHTLSNGSQYDHGTSYPSFSGFFNPDHSVNAPVP